MTPDPQSHEDRSKEKDGSGDARSYTNREQRYERGTAFDVFASHEEQDATHVNNDIANNDGSIVATLDNVFHGEAASLTHNDDEGSNRADYYEASELEKSAIEEEIDALEKKPKE